MSTFERPPFPHFSATEGLQGYLVHKKHPPPRSLPWAYAQGPTVALGGGMIRMSEVPLY